MLLSSFEFFEVGRIRELGKFHTRELQNSDFSPWSIVVVMKLQDDDDDVCMYVCVFERVAHVGKKKAYKNFDRKSLVYTLWEVWNVMLRNWAKRDSVIVWNFTVWLFGISQCDCVEFHSVIVWSLCVMLRMCQCCGAINAGNFFFCQMSNHSLFAV